MFKIDQHIEYLLLNHSCVIVPGFGGFVVHEVPARFDASDGMMLPPSTTVGFNQQLILNDSLLIQSFAEAYDLSYPEAQREIEHEVEELKGLILDNGKFEIHAVGTLSINTAGNYEFEPCQAGILVPRHYGLSGIDTNDNEAFAVIKKQTPVISAAEAPAKVVVVEEDDDEEEVSNEKVFSITASALKKIAVACIVVLFISALPFIAKNNETQRILSSIDTSFFTKFMPASEVKTAETQTEKETPINITKKTVVTEPQVKPADSKAVEPVPEKSGTEPTVVEEAETETQTYTIVLAAQVARNNAEIYVNDLKAIGFKDVRIIGEGKGRKVVMGTFKTEQEAIQARRDIAEKADLPSAWVMKMK